MAKFTDVISGLTESTDPQGDSDYIVGYDGSAVVKILIDNLGAAISLDALGAPSDSTSLNASTDAHGLLPKLTGVATDFLNAAGTYSTPAGSGGGFTTGDIHMVELHRESLTTDGNFDVSSISQDYDHLNLILIVRSSVNAVSDNAYMYFNNDTTATNYTNQFFNYASTTVSAAQDATPLIGGLTGSAAGNDATIFSRIEIFIPNYTSTTYRRVAGITYGHHNSSNNNIGGTTFIWNVAPAALNRITIQPDGYATDKFVTGSFLQIIGIKTEA